MIRILNYKKQRRRHIENTGQKKLLNIQHKSIYQSITFEGDSKILNRRAREELESFEEIESC